MLDSAMDQELMHKSLPCAGSANANGVRRIDDRKSLTRFSI
jgi:hypothetical protein